MIIKEIASQNQNIIELFQTSITQISQPIFVKNEKKNYDMQFHEL